MTESKELTTMTAEDLAKLKSMVNPEDMVAPPLPVVRINYDAESIHPRGAWVVGQVKDKDGNITNEGQLVNRFIILTYKNRHGFYNSMDTTKNCSSAMFTFSNGESVYGSLYPNQRCGDNCPNKRKDLNPRCKIQHVVYGVAYTEEGVGIDCQMYLQGKSFYPFLNHMKEVCKMRVSAGYMEVPPYTYWTLLETKKEKNAGTVYYVAEFTKNGEVDKKLWDVFREKREGAFTHIQRVNGAFNEKREKTLSGSSKADGAGCDEMTLSDLIDVTPNTKFAPTPLMLDAVKEEVVIDGTGFTGPTDDDDFDITAAIKNALGRVETTPSDVPF
jgi:hypothetical protein